MTKNEKRTEDMHLHTYYSDGTLSPRELVDRAVLMGMKTIAVTDHDGIDGLEEAINYGKQVGLKVVPGIEFSTIMPFDITSLVTAPFATTSLDKLTFDQSDILMNVHILGYGIDYKNEELLEAIKGIRRQRTERNEKLLKALNEAGYKIEKKDLYSRVGQDYIGKPNFALALVKKGYIKTTREANIKGEYLKHPKARLVRREKIWAQKAIELIKEAGGYSVLAHPMKLQYPKIVVDNIIVASNENMVANENTENKDFELLEIALETLISYGLEGMECLYSSHSKEEEVRLMEIAEKFSLRVTGGSDFHGPEFLPKVEIGNF